MIKLEGFTKDMLNKVARDIKGQDYYLFEEDLVQSGMDIFMHAIEEWLTSVGLDTTSVEGDRIVQETAPKVLMAISEVVPSLIETLDTQGLEYESIAASKLKHAQSAEDIVDAVMGTVPAEFGEFVKPMLEDTVNNVVAANPGASVDEVMEIVGVEVEKLIDQGPPEGTQFEDNPADPMGLVDGLVEDSSAEPLSQSEQALFNQLFG